MKRVAVMLATATIAACVPASEKLPPRGAAGFDTVPSAATTGEPFTTTDGWTVRVEKLVIQTSVAASLPNLGYGTSMPYVFDAQKPASVYARALPVGSVTVSLALYGRYISTEGDYRDRVVPINVDDETNERFNRLPDEGEDSGYTPGPSVILAVHAERDGRVVTFDMALNVTSAGVRSFDEAFGIPVEVREDSLSTVELPIDAALFFPVFDDVAASDADGDGTVTALELEASKTLTGLEQRISAALVR